MFVRHDRFNILRDNDGGGGGGPTPPAPAPTPPAPAPAPAAPPAGYLSQDEVNRISAQQKEEGKRAAEKAMADALGVTLEEAKAIVERQKQAELAAMSDAERAKAEAETEKAAAVQANAEAQRILTGAKVTAALVASGVPAAKLELVGRMVVVAPDADDAAIQAAVDSIKTTMPEAFTPGATPPPGTPPVPSSTPPGSPPPPAVDNDAMAKGAERAKTWQPNYVGIR